MQTKRLDVNTSPNLSSDTFSTHFENEEKCKRRDNLETYPNLSSNTMLPGLMFNSTPKASYWGEVVLLVDQYSYK